jgi:hypothetical protein
MAPSLLFYPREPPSKPYIRYFRSAVSKIARVSPPAQRRELESQVEAQYTPGAAEPLHNDTNVIFKSRKDREIVYKAEKTPEKDSPVGSPAGTWDSDRSS